jgi:hypothetical protein
VTWITKVGSLHQKHYEVQFLTNSISNDEIEKIKPISKKKPKKNKAIKEIRRKSDIKIK